MLAFEETEEGLFVTVNDVDLFVPKLRRVDSLIRC